MWVLIMLALAVAVTADCPRHCECKWRSGKESAVCARAGLNSVPLKLDPTTQLLDMADNRIVTLRDNGFSNAGLVNLQRLYLPGCNLKFIRQYAFRALENLVELDLSRNRLESVPSQAFDPIPELRELRLGGNPITKIKDESFSALPHLVRLSLSACKILEIETRAFKGLEGSLEYLELNQNKLYVLHVAVLAPLRSLKGLELANNPWNCNCALRPMRDWMIKKNVPATIVPDCALPTRLLSHSWDKLDLDDFACLPEVSGLSSHYKGLEGDDVTLVCQVNGLPAPRVRWVRAGRLLANTSIPSASFNTGKAFMLHSQGQTSNLTIKSADIQDSGLYTCNAENRAGKTEVVLSLTIEKKPQNKGFSGKALVAGMAVSAVIVLSFCLVGLCVYEFRKKRQLDRWNEQIVTSNNDNNYEKIETNVKTNPEIPKTVTPDNSRKRGDYRNVPSHDPEEDNESYSREVRDRRGSASPHGARWRRSELEASSTRSDDPIQDLHIPRLSEYNIRSDAAAEPIQSSKSAGLLSSNVEIILENSRFNNQRVRSRSRARIRDRFDNELSGSDSEKNYPDLIEMSAVGSTSVSRSTDTKYDPYYFYTIPRRKDGDSRSPLLSSRRNSSGGDSITYVEKYRQRPSGRRSSSFLDLSVGGSRIRRNPSLPASPSKEHISIPSATPLLDLSGLRDYSRMGQPVEDIDFRASQLEKFLEEYRTLREQLSRMKETRENLQRTRAAENEERRAVLKGKPSVAVTETSSSVALADAASPLALSPPEYKPQQPRPEWLTTLLYRN